MESTSSEPKTETFESIKNIYETSVTDTKNEVLQLIETMKSVEADETYSRENVRKDSTEIVKMFVKYKCDPASFNADALVGFNYYFQTSLKSNFYSLIKENVKNLEIDKNNKIEISFTDLQEAAYSEELLNAFNSYIMENVSINNYECVSKISKEVASECSNDLYTSSFKNSFSKEIDILNEEIVNNIKRNLQKQIYNLIQTEVQSTFTVAVLESLVPECTKAMCKTTAPKDLIIVLSEDDYPQLVTSFKASLKAEVQKGLTIKSDQSEFLYGFAFFCTDTGNKYYFTDETITNLYVENVVKDLM